MNSLINQNRKRLSISSSSLGMYAEIASFFESENVGVEFTDWLRNEGSSDLIGACRDLLAKFRSGCPWFVTKEGEIKVNLSISFPFSSLGEDIVVDIPPKMGEGWVSVKKIGEDLFLDEKKIVLQKMKPKGVHSSYLGIHFLQQSFGKVRPLPPNIFECIIQAMPEIIPDYFQFFQNDEVNRLHSWDGRFKRANQSYGVFHHYSWENQGWLRGCFKLADPLFECDFVLCVES